MANSLKNLVTGFMMSLSKVEKEGLTSLLDKDENNVNHETRVTQKEIKLISAKRFYDIIGKADEIDRRRHSDKLGKILEQRGIKGEVHHVFNNVRTADFFAPPDADESSFNYSFETSNELGRFADSAYILKKNGILELNMIVNHMSKTRGFKGRDLTDLKFFGLSEKGRVYAYGVNNYLGTKIDGAETVYVFDIFVIKDGEWSERITDTPTTMTKADLIDPRTYYYPTNDDNNSIENI